MHTSNIIQTKTEKVIFWNICIITMKQQRKRGHKFERVINGKVCKEMEMGNDGDDICLPQKNFKRL